MKKNQILLLGSLLVILIHNVSCGGGGGGAQPLGLFESNTNPSSTTPLASTDPAGAARVLSASDVVMHSSFEAGSGGSTTTGQSVGKGLTLTPSFGFQDFLSKVSKGTTINLATNCQERDSMNVDCTANAVGPISGNINAILNVHLTESSETKIAGAFDSTFNFNDFTFKDESCGKVIKVAGVFGCALNASLTLVQETQADFSMAGVCNTAKDPDLLLDVAIDELAHHVGYDLALNFQTLISAGDSRPIYLDESDVTGTVSVDGVNYPYAELRKVLGTSACQ